MAIEVRLNFPAETSSSGDVLSKSSSKEEDTSPWGWAISVGDTALPSGDFEYHMVVYATLMPSLELGEAGLQKDHMSH